MAIKITNDDGYIVDRATREAYDRLIAKARWSATSERSAEAFLRLVERYAARGIRLV
jgi:hypothetical protein